MGPIICPTCGEPFYSTDHPHMPFCSRRCQQIDMQRWLNEDQGLPVEEGELEDCDLQDRIEQNDSEADINRN